MCDIAVKISLINKSSVGDQNNCGINLQISKALRNTNQCLNDSKMENSWSTADWLAFNFVGFLLFYAQPQTLQNKWHFEYIWRFIAT